MARPPCCWKADYAASRPVVTAAGQVIELAISEKHDAFHGRPPLRGVRRARLARRSSVPSEAEASSLLAEAVERLGILHQDAVARSLVGGPLAQEVEQECVVRTPARSWWPPGRTAGRSCCSNRRPRLSPRCGPCRSARGRSCAMNDRCRPAAAGARDDRTPLV